MDINIFGYLFAFFSHQTHIRILARRFFQNKYIWIYSLGSEVSQMPHSMLETLEHLINAHDGTFHFSFSNSGAPISQFSLFHFEEFLFLRILWHNI